jgi:hypothetical protein
MFFSGFQRPAAFPGARFLPPESSQKSRPPSGTRITGPAWFFLKSGPQSPAFPAEKLSLFD